MITWMQHNKKYLIITIWVSVIAFVGAGFVGWGSLSFSNKSNSIASVGNHDISISAYQNTYQNYFNYFNSLNNGELTKEMAEQLGLRDIVIQSLINEALLLNLADEIGFIALESDVANLLTNNPAFQDENGNFNKDKYYAVLKNSGLKASEYEELLKKNVILNKVNNVFNLPATQNEKELFGTALFLEDKISLSTIRVADSDISLSDNETLTYWEVNKNSFLTEKEYEFDVVFVPASKNELKEEDIKAHYEEIKYFFKDKDEKILDYDKVKSQVENDLRLKLAENDALKVYLDFKKGDIEAQKNITIKESSNEYDINEFQTASVGDVIKPIKKNDGYEILKLTKISFPAPKSYENAKNDVEKALMAMKKSELLNSRAQARVTIFEGKDIGYIDRNDRSVDNLNSDESSQLVNKIFGSKEKYGYLILNDKAVLYKITDQRLPDDEIIANNEQIINQMIEQIKANEITSVLIKELRNRYKITQYIQGQ